MDEVKGVRLPFIPAGGVESLKKKLPHVSRIESGETFGRIFQEEINKLKFSGHAQTRMNTRDIKLSEPELIRLETAVLKADEKGSREALILLDDKAFIVSVPNRTVITAVEKTSLGDSVVTNIDSAIFA